MESVDFQILLYDHSAYGAKRRTFPPKTCKKTPARSFALHPKHPGTFCKRPSKTALKPHRHPDFAAFRRSSRRLFLLSSFSVLCYTSSSRVQYSIGWGRECCSQAGFITCFTLNEPKNCLDFINKVIPSRKMASILKDWMKTIDKVRCIFFWKGRCRWIAWILWQYGRSFTLRERECLT